MIYLAQLGPEGTRDLLRKQRAADSAGGVKLLEEDADSGRKAGFDLRLVIDAEQHKKFIEKRIREVHESQDIADALAKHVSTRRNVLRRIVDAVAVCYDSPPIRELFGVVEAEQVKFLREYRNARINTVAPSWGRYAFLCNVVHVLPRVEVDRGLQFTTVLPHDADVLWDPAGERDPSILIFGCRDHGARYVAVDSERWWWLSKDWKLIQEETHELGVQPWAEFRVEPRQPGDYWSSGRGQIMVDATLDIGRISAHMDHVRRTAARKTSALFLGANDDIPPGQTLQGEEPVVFRGDSTAFQVFDTVVNPAFFLSDIAAIFADVAESYGLPSTVIDLEPGSTSDAANVFGPAGPRVHERLTKIRNSHIKFLSEGEHTLATLSAGLLTQYNRLDVTAKQASEGFRMIWPRPTYADTPLAQVRAAEAQMVLGATDQIEFFRTQNPGLTHAEARAQVLRHIETRAEINEFQARRNLAADPRTEAMSVPQLQGMIGGQTAAENNSSPDGAQTEDETDDVDASK